MSFGVGLESKPKLVKNYWGQFLDTEYMQYSVRIWLKQET